ncbi:MAG TPA: hypothetical protein VEP50_12225 [bacterium]|nr:hypothetical protein [bacterium]
MTRSESVGQPGVAVNTARTHRFVPDSSSGPCDVLFEFRGMTRDTATRLVEVWHAR